VVKYNTDGQAIWAKASQGDRSDIGNGITTYGRNSVYVTGSFSSDSLTFAPYTIYNNNIPPPLDSTSFVVKFDGSGNVQWLRGSTQVPQVTGDIGYGVATGPNGNLYVSGSFPPLPGYIYFGNERLTPPGPVNDPMYILTYDSAGNLLCASVLSSGGDDQNSICADREGSAYIGGDLQISPFNIGSTSLPLVGNESTFVAKFNCGKLPTDIEVANGEKLLMVYPNPCSTVAHFKYIAGTDPGNAELVIYDLLGRPKISCPLSGSAGEISLNTHDLSSGVYFCSVLQNRCVVTTTRLVIQ